MISQKKKPRKLTRKERFRSCCPEFYERLVHEKVEKLPPDKKQLFYRLAALNKEWQYVRAV